MDQFCVGNSCFEVVALGSPGLRSIEDRDHYTGFDHQAQVLCFKSKTKCPKPLVPQEYVIINAKNLFLGDMILMQIAKRLSLV